MDQELAYDLGGHPAKVGAIQPYQTTLHPLDQTEVEEGTTQYQRKGVSDPLVPELKKKVEVACSKGLVEERNYCWGKQVWGHLPHE